MDRLDRLILGLRYSADDFDDITLREVLAMTDLIDRCVCRVGVQECPIHPGRLWSKDRKIEFRKAWDAKVTG